MNSLQIIVAMPLLSISFPKAVSEFTLIFNDICSFDILPHEIVNNLVFTFDPDVQPLRPNYEDAGFEVINFIQNSQSVFWFMVLYIFGLILSVGLIFRIKAKCLEKIQKWLRELLVFGFLIRLGIEGYLDFMVASLIQVKFY